MRPSLNPLPWFVRHPLPRALAGAGSCLGLCCALGCADGAPAPQAETAVETATPTVAPTGQTLSAYYTWYQDPNCQSGQPQTEALSCPEIGTPCPTTLLEASPVTGSAAEFVDLFFVAPSQTAGLRLETLVDGLANQASGSFIDSYPALATCTAYGQYGLASPPTASYSLLDCLTGFLETGGLAQCGSGGASP